MRIGGILRFERLTMKHFFGEIENTKKLIDMIRETQKGVRIRALKFERDIEEIRRK